MADFLKAGCEVTILFADLHAFLDNMKEWGKNHNSWTSMNNNLNMLEYILWRENYMFCQLVEGFSLVVLGCRLRGSCWSWGRSTTSRSSRPCCSALMFHSTSSSLFAEQTTSSPRQDWDILKYEVKNNQQATVAKIKTRIFFVNTQNV